MLRWVLSLLAVVALGGLLAPRAATAGVVTIDTVPVGNAGNDPDGNGRGAVDYDYRIGTYEVTVGQYTAFLNSVAATDTYGLYNSNMATNLNIAGIARSGSPGSYAYSVIGSPHKPVTYVNWGDAARFANWLHNGQPSGAQDATTTEDGAYTLSGWTEPIALFAVPRNPDAVWFLPSFDEWYKAAYHKNDGVTDNYWNYPTSSDTVPYSASPPGSGAPAPSNVANYFADDGLANGYNDGYAATGSAIYDLKQNYLTDVGSFLEAASPYGTFDQGGNVWEWADDFVGAGSYDGQMRYLRYLAGGAWYPQGPGVMSAGTVSPSYLETENFHIGFRVATVVPEPSSWLLGLMGMVAVFLARRKFRQG